MRHHYTNGILPEPVTGLLSGPRPVTDALGVLSTRKSDFPLSKHSDASRRGESLACHSYGPPLPGHEKP
ncbi:hypothetical protein ACFL0H_13220 [Thermodesulfobacteriota bacterium]